MKNITIHPMSALLGAAVLAIPFVLVSFQQQPWPPHGPLPVTVREMPNPHNFVQIKEGEPYAVPRGKLFVLTGLGAARNSWDQAFLLVNGNIEVGVDRMLNSTMHATWDTVSVSVAPPGFSVAAGDVITLDTENHVWPARAWGYLVDA